MANELDAIMKDPNSNNDILSLFKWLILNTKAFERFHIILVSSDICFHSWVSGFIGTSRYANYVIEDLTKKAHKSYATQIVACYL